jgi:predicted nucleic acid-binding protein
MKPILANAVRAFLDSNVIIYAFLEDYRTARSLALLEKDYVISVQTLNEFANVTRRKYSASWSDVNEFLLLVRAKAIATVPLTTEIHTLGLHIAERYQLSIYDGLILSAALEANCDTLYSEDMQDGMVIEGRLLIRNPFAKD